jgi:hypothetical protein
MLKSPPTVYVYRFMFKMFHTPLNILFLNSFSVEAPIKITHNAKFKIPTDARLVTYCELVLTFHPLYS